MKREEEEIGEVRGEETRAEEREGGEKKKAT